MLLTLPAKISSKVGIKADTLIMAISPPDNYPALLSDLPDGVRFVGMEEDWMTGDIHIFVHTREDLEHVWAGLPIVAGSKGRLWIFYPKKTSRIRTDLDFDKLLQFAHDSGITNVQLTDIDMTWSGMEFVAGDSLS